MRLLKVVVVTLNLIPGLLGGTTANLDFEDVQLTEDVIRLFPDVAFGDASMDARGNKSVRCKSHPGDIGWPSRAQWAAFNKTLGGNLLHPVPAETACYPGPYHNETQCDFLLGPVNQTRFYLDDPLTVLTTWPEGDTCLADPDPHGNCTRGGFPEYVVNATTVRDVQLAVNFARNRNLRLNIKNTGHDFVGRSTGYGSLGVWTHYLKGIELIPGYSMGEYQGTAVRMGAGVEAFEGYNLMAASNITFVVPGDFTVGAAGGWLAGGGHSGLTSLLGLGSDQPLSINVVTADGRFITADVNTNKDLFFALRGGGGSTFGIVTSVISKTYPGPLNTAFASASLATGPAKPANTSNGVFPVAPPVTVDDTELFWKAYGVILAFGKEITDAGGLAFGDLTPLGNNSFLLASSFSMPNLTVPQTEELLRPVFESLRSIGINTTDPPVSTFPYGFVSNGTGDIPGHNLFASRLFPRDNWADAALFQATTRAIRDAVEAGFIFNGINYSPTVAVAGYPGDNAVNPAFRKTLMHATVFDPLPVTAKDPGDFLGRHDRLNAYMDGIRAVTPGSGAYINEADVLEPDWQRSFFGSNYERLLAIKTAVDPWGLFWAPTTVGSEAWRVVTKDGLPTQDGPLCRTGSI